MNIHRRTFAKSLTAAAIGSAFRPWNDPVWAQAAQAKTPPVLARAAAALPKAIVTKIRVLTPTTGSNRNSITAAFNQSNMIILVETDAGITGVGEGGSPDLVASLAPSVVGRNAFDTELIWQHMYMDPFYSPGREKIHALGGIDMALWDIKAKALNVPLYMLCGGKVREHVQFTRRVGFRAMFSPDPHSRRGRLRRWRPVTTRTGSTDRFNRTRDSTELSEEEVPARCCRRPWRWRGCRHWRSGARWGWTRWTDVRLARAHLVDREGRRTDARRPWIGRQLVHRPPPEVRLSGDGRICRLIEPFRPYFVEDPVREEQFRTQIPKLRLLTSVPFAPGEQWGQRWEFNTLVEDRDIDFARATLPNVGGVTEMLKIMAMCDTHKVGIVPHFTDPSALPAIFT